MINRGAIKSISRSQMLIILIVIVITLLGLWRLMSSVLDTGVTYKIKAYGINSDLQLGGADKTRRTEALSPLELTKATSELTFISAKAAHHNTLLLTDGGEVYSMGDTSPPSGRPNGDPKRISFPYLKSDERIAEIDATRDHNIAVTTEGRVYTWGSNYTGQLGDDSNTDRVDPQLVGGLPKIISVTAGYRHSAAIAEDGSVYAWGGSCSQIAMSQAESMIQQATSNITALGGYGSTNQSDLISNHADDCKTLASTFIQSKTPKKLVGLGDNKAVQISAGYGHILVRDEQGALYSAGCNTYKQLGREKDAESATKNDLVRVQLDGSVKQISAGYRHSAVLLEDGTAMAWGYAGPAGGGLLIDNDEQTIAKPTKITGDKRFLTIEAAHDTTFGVTDKLDLVGWGQDDAKAFWKMGVAKSPQSLGTISTKDAVVSGSMWHIVVQEMF